MKVKIKHLRVMLEELCKKADQPNDLKGLQIIAEEIGLKDLYLYKIQNRIEKKRNDQEELKFHGKLLDKIAKFLKFKNFRTFVDGLERGLESQLISCEGSYYSYVRRNAVVGVLFRSPVRIWTEVNNVRFELRGPSLVYQGTIQLRHGCLFIQMESKEGKAFYHVYKIGKRESPKVLQGTFSGVSTAFDPIGGRAILMRVDEPYNSLENAALKITDIKKSKSLNERRLADYFKDYANNNVSPNKSYSFDLSDLGDCE